MLRFRVADTLTCRIVGRLTPSKWSFTDPLTGKAEGQLTVPIPRDLDQVRHLADLVTPQTRQVCAWDGSRYWFGGPITADTEHGDDGTLTIPFGDWRAWFYAALIWPNPDETRRDYIRTGSGNVDQCQAVADLADIGLDTTGAPRIVVDSPPVSGIERDVEQRMFAVVGDAIDNVVRRERGTDWWTYLTPGSDDPTSVVAHVTVAWPERGMRARPLGLRHELGKRGNILTYRWPQGQAAPSRVYGLGQAPAPNEDWAVAEDPAVADGERIVWAQTYRLPSGITTADTAFEHALARQQALGDPLNGVVEATLDPAATDLATWGPGERARLIVRDGWRDVDIPDTRIVSRTLTGVGDQVSEVKVSINLAGEAALSTEEPGEVATDGEGEA